MPKKKPSTFCKNPLTIKDFESLPQDGETILLDDESLDTMYYIQEVLRLLEPEGMDDVRTLRIETIGPKNKIYWYDVTVHIYKDMHGIYLHSYQGERYYFTNKDHLNEDPNPVRHNCKKFLNKLWQYLADVVHGISNDPRAYTRYLEEHIPYQEREGYVVRGQIQDILPGIKINIANREQVLEILKRRQEIPADGYETITLRRYIEAWKVAYCAFCDSASLEKESAEEVFRRSNCGRALEEYNLDAPEDFARWDKDRYPYHCYDIAYVRMQLYPEQDENTGRWHFELAFGLSCYADEGFRVAFALEKAGIPFLITGAEDKTEAILGEDTIYFSPDERDHQLPYPGEDGVTEEQVQQAISLITWKHFEDIHTIVTADKRAKIVYYPCNEDNFPTDDERDRCLIRIPSENGWQYWLKRFCPYPWFNLAKAGAEYAILPAWPEY